MPECNTLRSALRLRQYQLAVVERMSSMQGSKELKWSRITEICKRFGDQFATGGLE